jgi:pimeloyl-ACP methyl ester carboxylesterase
VLPLRVGPKESEARIVSDHYLPVELPWGTKSRAYWSITPATRLVVFVHGFCGESIKTWVDFPGLLAERPSGKNCDIVFYGYDGLRARIVTSAVHLLEFLDEAMLRSHRLVNATVDRDAYRKSFIYDRVLLVAHSLGAVVVRQALLDARRAQCKWAPKAGMVLFAPAHHGASILPLVTSVMGAFKLAPIEAIARWRFQVLQDLQPGSKTLTQLQSETAAGIAAGASYLVAKAVAHAQYDDVVDPNHFCSDPVPSILARSHMEVCKPDRGYLAPIELVEAHL